MARAIAFLTLALATGCAFAGKPEDASAALAPAQRLLAAGRFDEAYTGFSKHSARNGLAQFTLGLFHQQGWGRPVDAAGACRWFQKAAHRQVPAAQHLLGDCLLQGTTGRADADAALAWYLQAADNGHLISLCHAAELLIRGDRVAPDAERGLALCTRAAQADLPLAMVMLAGFHEAAAQPDLRAARHWYRLAAERRSSQAQHRLGVMLAQGEGGDPDLNAALFWLETAASEGHAPAYLPTALLYANAPRQPDTQSLSPEHLAKVYLWASAAKSSAANAAQRQQAEALESQALAAMPPTWQPSLDKKVAAHLSRHKH
jgi:hypothetical protein